jgi:hypothetical protein
LAGNRKITDGDRRDSHDYAAACYADLFVTEDGILRDTLADAPNNPAAVVAFGDFAALMPVAPH